MFLLYLDASGSPLLSDSTKHYALVGAAVHENTWFALNNRIRGLKRRYAFPGEDFELHAMCFNTIIEEQNRVIGFEGMNHADKRQNVEKLRSIRLQNTVDPEKRKRLSTSFRREYPFIHLTRAERTSLYEDALDLIGGHRGLVLFGEAVSKQHPAIANRSIDPVRQTFEQVVTRFDAYLKRNTAWSQLTNSRRVRGNKGLIVMDRDLEREAAIERQFANYVEQGHPWGQLEYVVDTPFFVSSEKFPGVQIVDICAYALRRYLDKGAVKDSTEEKQLRRIFHLFDRSGGSLHGLRHYVQSNVCKCIICAERGHGPLDIPATASLSQENTNAAHAI